MDEAQNREILLYGDGIGKVGYVDHMGTDLTIVNAARVSYGTSKFELDNRDKKLIKYLIRNKHTSTLEHNIITFKFVVPLYVRSQHHRHRTWSYNEISRRYTDKDLRFYEPERFRTQHKSNKQSSNAEELINPEMTTHSSCLVPATPYYATDLIIDHHSNSLKLFNRLLNAGVCREQARGVLPQNLYTEYYGTCNLSNLLKFIDLRAHPHAQWEIQKVAQACLTIAKELWPNAVQSYRDIRYGDKQVTKS